MEKVALELKGIGASARFTKVVCAANYQNAIRVGMAWENMWHTFIVEA